MTDQELFAMFDDYQLGRGLAATTRRRRAISLRSFARFLAPRTVTTTKPGDVDKWLAGFRTPASKAAYYGDLGAFFKWAHRRDVVAINPMSLTDPPKKPRHLPRPCKAEVIALAVAMAKNGQTQLMILLGALAGLRVSEIAALASKTSFSTTNPRCCSCATAKVAGTELCRCIRRCRSGCVVSTTVTCSPRGT